MANLLGLAMLSAVNGVLPVDKPAGLSVHDAMRQIKDYFNLSKIAHGGTIANADSGLVLFLLGSAGKISSDAMALKRTFSASLVLGRTSSTCDAQGEISPPPQSAVDLQNIINAIPDAVREFTGDVLQKPPRYSAIKRHFEETYSIVETAKQDEPEHLYHVFRLKTESPEQLPDGSIRLNLTLSCSKGFNLRAFARDFGSHLGTGAYLESAKCLAAGKFTVENAVKLVTLLSGPITKLPDYAVPFAG